MFKNKNQDQLIFRLIAVAILSYIAIPIADHLSAFIMGFISVGWAIETDNYWVIKYIPGVIGHSITGYLLGIGLIKLFQKSARNIVKYIPLFIIFSAWIRSYIAVTENLLENFVPIDQLGYLLTSYMGFNMLVVIPASAFIAIWYFQKTSAQLSGTNN